MHVLVVIDHIYPDEIGGSYIYAYEVARRLVGRGYRVSALVAKPEPGFPDRDCVEGIEIYRFDRVGPRNHPRSFLSRVTGARRLFRRLHRESPVDLIHFQAPLISVGVMLAPESRGLPRLATIQGPGHSQEYLCEARFTRDPKAPAAEVLRHIEESPPGLRDRLYCAAVDQVEGWYLRHCGRILALSDYSLESFAATHRIDRSRTALMPGGVDTDRFQPGPRAAARQALGWPAEAQVLFTLRRLTPRMGLDNLIRAMSEVRQAVPGVSLVIGGEGPMRPALGELISRLGLQSVVRLAGRLPEEQLPTYYQAADLFVLPTVAAEGFGLVTVEALACNVPAFGTPVGGTVEVLGRINADLLFEGAEPSAMARKIIEFCRRPEPFYRNYRDEVVRSYSWTAVLDGLERHYEELCPGRTRLAGVKNSREPARMAS